jgi:hypothetical protein
MEANARVNTGTRANRNPGGDLQLPRPLWFLLPPHVTSTRRRSRHHYILTFILTRNYRLLVRLSAVSLRRLAFASLLHVLSTSLSIRCRRPAPLLRLSPVSLNKGVSKRRHRLLLILQPIFLVRL